MPKAIRYRARGKPLRHTLFYTFNSDYLGAHHGVPIDAIFDADIAAIEEAQTIESHRQDFALAFGIPADEIECEVLAWDGDVTTLPREDEPDALERLPEEQRDGYTPPIPPPLTTEQRLEALLDALGTDVRAKVDAALDQRRG